ncbi:MAG: ATP-binding protein [Clostridia bacterium]|nr:ATP-binding protein [Clostridia bacterium]
MLIDLSVKKRIPTGIDDFERAVSSYYYVDKTLLIKDLIDRGSEVTLFTRPRRFGKSLNLSMIRSFFEKTDEDTSVYFKDKKIWQCGSKYTSEQGTYPVIYLNFKDMKKSTWEETLAGLKMIIAVQYAKFGNLVRNTKLEEIHRILYDSISRMEATQAILEGALQELTEIIKLATKKMPVVLIDEYDAPIQSGYANGFYNEAISFMRNFLSSGLKTNVNISFAVLTGVLRVSKESIFSSLNNVNVYSVLNERFSEYFGFTKEEVKELLSYYGCADAYDDVANWYDGYLFGSHDMFNPLSVLMFLEEGVLDVHWGNSSDTGLIGKMLLSASSNIKKKIRDLMDGKSVYVPINENIVYPKLMQGSNIFSLLLMSGYLKPDKGEGEIQHYAAPKRPSATKNMNVIIPNTEVRLVYIQEIVDRFANIDAPIDDLWEGILSCDAEVCEELLRNYLINSVSYHDYSEDFYQGLIMGLCFYKDGEYIVDSNKESGLGRYDVCMEPALPDLPGIIFEIESYKIQEGSETGRETRSNSRKTGEILDKLAREAIEQINTKMYCQNLKRKGITNIIKVGISFNKKDVRVLIRNE